MISILIPALNEELAIATTLQAIHDSLTKFGIEHEIIVINDGSSDQTGEIANSYLQKYQNGFVINHPEPGGYGLSLKDGIRKAKYDFIGISDADGTYPVDKFPDLLGWVAEANFDMAVGARKGAEYRGSFLKMPARRLFLWLSEYASGRTIEDINSGLRVFRKKLAIEHIRLIGNGFSFTTTITLAAMLNGYYVKYIPIEYHKRIGHSHIRYWRDSLRSLQIIVENILFYNPLKLFLLLIDSLLVVGLLSFSFYFFSSTAKAYLFFGTLSALSFSSIFIVAALGLATNLNRLIRKK